MFVNVYEPDLSARSQYEYAAEGAANPTILVAHRRRMPVVLLAYEVDGSILWTWSLTGTGDWAEAATLCAGTCPVLLDDPATRRIYLFYHDGSNIKLRTQDAGGGWSAAGTGPATATCAGLSARASQVDGGIALIWSDGADIYLAESADGGGSWSAPAEQAEGTYPHLLIDRGLGRRWLTYWRNGDIYLRRADHGGAFGDESALSLPDPPQEKVMTVRVLSARQSTLVLWYVNDSDELVVVQSADDGATWS